MKIPTFCLAPTCFVVIASSTAFAQIGGSLVSPPSMANQTGGGDTGHEFAPSLVTNNGDIWTCVFTTNDVSLTNGGDMDVFWIRSRDLGVTWSVPAPISTSFLTDSGITASDVDAAVGTDGSQRMVVWASTKVSPTGNYGIYSGFSASTGTTWTNTLPVGFSFATDTVDDRNPCIAGANGTFVTVWERDNSGESDLYFARTILNGGSSWSAPARIDASSASDTGSDTHPRIATDGAGNWVVVYESNEGHFGTGTDSEIYSYHSADDGITWTGPALVNSTGTSDGSTHDSEPCVAVDRASGNWICAWKSNHTFGGITGGDSEILRAISIANGASWQAPAIVNQDFATDQSRSTGDAEPFVHADQDGHFTVNWTRTMLNDSDTDLRAARSDDLGGTWTAPALIDIDANVDSGNDSKAQLVSDDDGHWLAVWQTGDDLGFPVGPDLDIFASRFLIPAGDSFADFCFGYTETGNSPRCPCGNDSSITSRRGCANSTGTGGSVGMIGPYSASAPTQVISVSGVSPGAPVLLFQGDGQYSFGVGIQFGDGLLCAGGAITRLGVIFVGPTGNGGLNFTPTGVSSGSIRFYQGWYRDSATFCTSATFNLTSAFGTVWAP